MSDVAPSSDSPVSASPVEQTASTQGPQRRGSSLPRHPIQQPQGYPRRTHKKSRTGCATCKSRKIKCDERHPACLNCISHGVECPFKTAAAANASRDPKAQSHSPASSTSTLAPQPNPATRLPEGGELPLLELELLHNFTTKTYKTLTADPCLWLFWRDDVVQLGFTCDYIMRAVLAVSALHLAYNNETDRRDFYIEEGILLHQKASRSAMLAMAAGDIDKHQAARLFLFSMLTVFFALASPRRSNPDGSFFIGESGFPDWAFLLGGGKHIMHVLGDDRARGTVAFPFLDYGHGRWHAQQALLRAKGVVLPDPEQAASPTIAVADERRLLAPLRTRIQRSVSDPELLGKYAFALDELEMALVVREDPDTPRDVLDAMVWLWRVTETLVPLLRVPTQEAVAIFAHFCVLLKHYGTCWWLQGWGDAMMARAREILDAEHQEWIEWPLREMAWMEANGAK